MATEPRYYTSERGVIYRRGSWRRIYDRDRFRYYYRRLRVPWILWAMFS